jgi:5-formyltetrahydrofolate cyclo-ligase
MDPAREKKELRRRMRALRLVADQKQGPDAALGLVRAFLPRLGEIGLAAGAVIAGYWPIVTEIDIRPLLARLNDRGFALALPAVLGSSLPLVFRRWRPEDDLEPGERETMQPGPAASEVRPDLVFVPMLGYDARGVRLGQGGGHYDRTLAALRRTGPVIAVGVAYAAQRVDRVPCAATDQRLDWILTEDDCRRVPA